MMKPVCCLLVLFLGCFLVCESYFNGLNSDGEKYVNKLVLPNNDMKSNDLIFLFTTFVSAKIKWTFTRENLSLGFPTK